MTKEMKMNMENDLDDDEVAVGNDESFDFHLHHHHFYVSLDHHYSTFDPSDYLKSLFSLSKMLQTLKIPSLNEATLLSFETLPQRRTQKPQNWLQ